MLKMTGYDVLFAAAGNLYLLLALACIGVALWKGQTWTLKLVWAALVFALFAAPIAPDMYRTVEYRSRLAKAQALFDERCKTAGEKIYRTVEGVDGVLLVNLRPDNVSYEDQFARFDPYGYESGGEWYIRSYLPGHWRTCVGDKAQCPPEKRAFLFVDAISETGGRVRYVSVDRVTSQPPLPGQNTGIKIVTENSIKNIAQYGVRWEDISTNEDRQNWIAGGSLTVVDLRNGEVLAERSGYLMDPGLGSTASARTPWSWARHYAPACPKVDGHNFTFVRKVLHSSKGA